MPDHFRHQLQQIRVSHQNVVLDAEMTRGGAGEIRFIVGLFGEADGEGLHLLSKPTDEPGEKGVRIDSAAQEQTERNVATQPKTKALVDLGFYFLKRRRVIAF